MTTRLIDIKADALPKGIVAIIEIDGSFYQVPLSSLTPAFEPVDLDDCIRGPIKFTPSMEHAYTHMVLAGSHGPNIFAYLDFETAVLLCFYHTVYGLGEGEELSFANANADAIRRSDYYPGTTSEEIPAARFHWEQAAARAWRQIKQELRS